jgi:hypothetical protein
MGERFTSFAGGVASGTDKTILTLFDPAATPTRRGRIFDFVVGSDDTPADQACRLLIGRITAVGTEGSGWTPVNIDPGGPAGEYDAGVGTFGGEPTYTASKNLITFSLNQRATFRWCAVPGGELMMAATQNNGAGLKSSASTSTQAYEATVFHEE